MSHKGRLLGRLDHDCITCSQCRRHLHAKGYKRAVPGDDDADYPIGFRTGVDQFIGRWHRYDLAVDLVGPAGVVARPLLTYPRPASADGNRRATLDGCQTHEFAGIGSNEVSQAVEQHAALSTRRAPPDFERLAGAGHCLIHLSRASQGNIGLVLTVRGVDVGKHATTATAELTFTNQQVDGRRGTIIGHIVFLRAETAQTRICWPSSTAMICPRT
ncbi:hypothetical protein D3C76_1196770 [compost metagenome]